MDTYRQLGIGYCRENGINITGNQYDKAIVKYNNGRMPISELKKRLADSKEPGFLKFIKDRGYYG